MADFTKKEIKRLKEEKAYWEVLSDLVGWKLMGWTYKFGATYITTDNFYRREDTVQLTGSQRDDLVLALMRQHSHPTAE